MQQIIYNSKNKDILIERAIRDNTFDAPSQHSHPQHEIYYLLNGERYYFFEDRTYYVKAGSLVLAPANSLHKTSLAPSSSSHERVLLMLSENKINPLLTSMHMPSLSRIIRQQTITQISSSQELYLLELFETISRELNETNPFHESLVMLKLIELLIFIYRSTSTSPSNDTHLLSSLPKHTKVTAAIAYINQNYQTALSLQNIADHIYVSKGYLSGIFNEITGMKITEYINIQRIKHAMRILENKNMSITDVALEAGFENVTYFEKVFRKHTGFSPLQYRKAKLSGSAE